RSSAAQPGAPWPTPGSPAGAVGPGGGVGSACEATTTALAATTTGIDGQAGPSPEIELVKRSSSASRRGRTLPRRAWRGACCKTLPDEPFFARARNQARIITYSYPQYSRVERR